MAIDTLGMSQHQIEVAKWNTPRREGGMRPDGFEPFPQMVYKARKREDGKVVVDDPEACQRIVGSAGELALAHGQGWHDGPTLALEAFEAAEQALGQAAAERAAADRRMSDAAQREAAAIESQTGAHLGEIPEAPKRKPGRPRKVPAV